MPDAGDLIGPYRLVSPLGKGAMGEVWRARDERLDRFVALKVLPADAAEDLEYRARMLREARAAAAIRHANVVTLFDIVTHEGNDLLVMELVEGRTLSETLRKDGAPTLEVALRWIEGVADALVAAHERGVLHRDIKAANIMVTSEGGVKVLDFGLAKLRDEVIAHGSSTGLPASTDTGTTTTDTKRDGAISLEETMPSESGARTAKPDTSREVSLDATMASEPGTRTTAPAPSGEVAKPDTSREISLDATMASEPGTRTTAPAPSGEVAKPDTSREISLDATMASEPGTRTTAPPPSGENARIAKPDTSREIPLDATMASEPGTRTTAPPPSGEVAKPDTSREISLDATMASEPGTRTTAPPPSGEIAKPDTSREIPLDATMASEPGTRTTAPPSTSGELSLAETRASGGAVAGTPAPKVRAGLGASSSTASSIARSRELASYETHAGSLLGTPLYMAPEQVSGGAPDERSEVFSVGVLAHEILNGKSPYTATTIDMLFQQILGQPPPPLPQIPAEVFAVVARALEKDPEKRFPSMIAFRDAIAVERHRLFAPRARKWPLFVAAGLLVVGAIAGVLIWRANRAVPSRPGDDHVTRALAEYDVFFTDKALSSLRAGLREAPAHPRLNAYLVLFGGSSDLDRAKAIAAAKQALDATAPKSKDRALLEAAISLAERGPAAARDSLVATGASADRELAFWTAELDYRAAQYARAGEGYKTLLDDPSQKFRGRIYDHYSAVLLYLDDPLEALRIGTLYRDAFKGEADAIGVYATTLAAAGRYDEAVVAAEEAAVLAEGEDTLAGLAKVLALKGDRTRAKELYRRSLDRAGPTRRPVRRAALALLRWIDGDVEGAKAIVAPCLAGDDDAARERGACLFVAGVVDPTRLEAAAQKLDELALAATPIEPAYGQPAALAKLLRVRATFFGGGCLVDPTRVDVQAPSPSKPDPASYDVPLDFYAAYHVPFFATWATCEKAAVLATTDRAAAAALLEPVAKRAFGRAWLLDDLAKLR